MEMTGLVNQKPLTEQVEQSETLFSLKSMITNLARRLRDEKKNQKQISEQMSSVLENDTQYNELVVDNEVTKNKLKVRKQQLATSNQMLVLKAKDRESKAFIKDIKTTLSNHLNSYVKMAGVQSIDTPAGDEVTIVVKASIKPTQLRLF